MTLSVLIAQLQDLKRKHGNLEVVFHHHDKHEYRNENPVRYHELDNVTLSVLDHTANLGEESIDLKDAEDYCKEINVPFNASDFEEVVYIS